MLTQKPARLTIDLEPLQHAEYKAACAMAGTNMVEEVRKFIANFIEKRSKKSKHA